MGAGAAAAIGGIGSLAGGFLQSGAASQAASEQAQAAEYAANLQFQQAQQANALIQNIYSQNVTRLQPFVSAGGKGTEALLGFAGLGPNTGGTALASQLTQPFEPTMEQLSQTPGYQFALQQGELATKNSFSAQGLGGSVTGGGNGPSGPLGKALANYAEGLASTTYQQQFTNYLAQNQQIYGMLGGLYGGLSSLGENAAAQTGNMGTTAGGQSANALLQGASGFGQYSTAGAAATAAGITGSANALAGGLQGGANGVSSALLYNQLFGGGGGLFGGNSGAASAGTAAAGAGDAFSSNFDAGAQALGLF